MGGIKNEIFNDILQNVKFGFQYYKHFLFGLFTGLFIAWCYHRFLGYRSLKKSYERVIESKQETIDSLKMIVHERISKMEVQVKDKSWFIRLKKHFKNKNK